MLRLRLRVRLRLRIRVWCLGRHLSVGALEGVAVVLLAVGRLVHALEGRLDFRRHLLRLVV